MKTLAVVIGNNNYFENAKLENAVNDAKGIADAFGELGYDIIHKEDCTINDSVNILTEFNERINNYEASIFYFAGHGFQLDGDNYLASIDCQVANPNKHHFSKTCIMLSEILDILKKNSQKVNIVIIDACRKSFDRGVSASFTPVQAPKGTLIAFSTSPGDGAKDSGIEGHSIYTGALLKYIGRERLSVELLFKKVRKTVFALSEGTQTTWEHTSLIGDFYFNEGQKVYSVQIPYNGKVIKDYDYTANDEYSSLIMELKSQDWNRQNPAIEKIRRIPPNTLDKNQKFILGRNLLQANGYAFKVANFFENLNHNIAQYSDGTENHVLNGMLFEIYFNNIGEFRGENFKKNDFENIFALREDKRFKKSFSFLKEILEPYKDFLFYIPGDDNDDIIDVDVLAVEDTFEGIFGKETYQVISRIIAFSTDIVKPLSKYGIHGQNALGLKKALSNYLFAPIKIININSNIELSKIAFPCFEDQSDNPFL